MLMVCKTIIIQKTDTYMPSFLFSIAIYHAVLHIGVFVVLVAYIQQGSLKERISKTMYNSRLVSLLGTEILETSMCSQFSALWCVCMLYVCILEHKIEISTLGSAFPWDFHKLSQS